MAGDLRSGTVAGLLDFLDYAAAKVLMNQRTAAAWKSACVKVLEIDGEGWRDRKVAELDIESQFDRFSRKSAGNYTPGSLATYEQRFRDSISQYEDFLANPTGFRGQQRRQASKAAKVGATSTTPSKKVSTGSITPSAPRAEELITYPFPLETGVLGYVQLPREISEVDVERLCDFVRSLALRRQPRGGSQPDET